MNDNARTVATELKSGKSKTSSRLASGQLLDSLEAAQQSNQYSYELAEILEYMRLEPTMKAFEILAHDLSKLARHEPEWTKKYIHSVYRERLEPSPELARTIDALAQTIDGTPAGVAGSVWVKVLANPDIPEGVLIPASVQVVKCARPGCPVMFIKTHPNQKYHDRSCRGKQK